MTAVSQARLEMVLRQVRDELRDLPAHALTSELVGRLEDGRNAAASGEARRERGGGGDGGAPEDGAAEGEVPSGPGGPQGRLWRLAEDLAGEFDYCEPSLALVRLENLLEERRLAAGDVAEVDSSPGSAS